MRSAVPTHNRNVLAWSYGTVNSISTCLKPQLSKSKPAINSTEKSRQLSPYSI